MKPTNNGKYTTDLNTNKIWSLEDAWASNVLVMVITADNNQNFYW